MAIGKLQKISLREVWNHEAYDFTNWLANEENISLLSDELGIDIIVDKTEAEVGNFSLDILAKEEQTNRIIVIENQLEPTNHDHLGKIITYASGYDAEIIIWIVKEARDEHKQAIDWLNEHTDEKINIFLVKIELWQIDNSIPAPKFQIVSQPNNWAKTIKRSINQCEHSETKLLQLEFWDNFKTYCQNTNCKFRLRKPSAQHWYDISIGSSEAHICLTVNSRENSMGCEIWISNNKDMFYSLENNKEQIELELSESLEWLALENRKCSRIKLSQDIEFENTEKWNEAFDWLKNKATDFHSVFGNYIKQIKE